MEIFTTQDPEVDLPHTVVEFLKHATLQHPRRIYTDGSFAVTALSLENLSLSSTDLVQAYYSRAAKGVYLPSFQTAEALALVISTSQTLITKNC